MISNIFNHNDYQEELKFYKNSIGLIENERPSWGTVVTGENKMDIYFKIRLRL